MTTSPMYPQANELVERSVQTAKQLLKKAKGGSQDPFLSPLEYRNPQIDGLSSPAQLLVSRTLRASLPVTRDQLKPEVVNPRMANKRGNLKQVSQRYYHNKGAKQLQPLETGTHVVTGSNVLRTGSLQTKLNAGLSEQQQEDLFQSERSFHEVKL